MSAERSTPSIRQAAMAVEAQIANLTLQRDLYQQALELIARWPAAGKAQEVAKTALSFGRENA